MKRTAILQSSYIPWTGYFAIIGLVDEFVLYDDAEYSKGGWRNRNKIKTSKGTAWLTIPVFLNGRSTQKIREAEITDRRWASRHWGTIQSHYSRAPYFRVLAPTLEQLYKSASAETLLTRVNELFLRVICEILEITTNITRSSEYELRGDRNERLIGICRQVDSTQYLTGPSARAYIDAPKFSAAGISLSWMDYSELPEYRQLHTPPFVHEVTILDLLLNEGIEGARSYMRKVLSRCEETVFDTVRDGGIDIQLKEKATPIHSL